MYAYASLLHFLTLFLYFPVPLMLALPNNVLVHWSRALSRYSTGVGAVIETKTQILFLDIHLTSGATYTHTVPPSYNGFIYVWRGAGELHGATPRPELSWAETGQCWRYWKSWAQLSLHSAHRERFNPKWAQSWQWVTYNVWCKDVVPLSPREWHSKHKFTMVTSSIQ